MTDMMIEIAQQQPAAAASIPAEYSLSVAAGTRDMYAPQATAAWTGTPTASRTSRHEWPLA
eukprot:scaffold168198_cov31-Tisochrysis_lutea.AAC.1